MSKTYWFVEPLLVLSLKQNPLEERQSLGYIHTEKAMAPYSSTLAWRIPGMGEPRGLPSMGLHRVRHH